MIAGLISGNIVSNTCRQTGSWLISSIGRSTAVHTTGKTILFQRHCVYAHLLLPIRCSCGFYNYIPLVSQQEECEAADSEREM